MSLNFCTPSGGGAWLENVNWKKFTTETKIIWQWLEIFFGSKTVRQVLKNWWLNDDETILLSDGDFILLTHSNKYRQSTDWN